MQIFGWIISIHWSLSEIMEDLFMMPYFASLGHDDLYWYIMPGGCFTTVWGTLQNSLAKIHSARNHLYGENFKLQLCMCGQSPALATHTNFQLEILIRSKISAIHKFHENILESSWNLSETIPWCWPGTHFTQSLWAHNPNLVKRRDALEISHWGRDKMASVSQTTLSNAFSWTKMLEFRLRFHWSLFLRVQLTVIQHCFR